MRSMSDYRKSASKRPARRKRLVDPFSTKASTIRNKRRPVKKEHNQTPLPHDKHPLFSRVLGRRPWAELRNRFSEGNGVVSEAGKGVVYLGRCFVRVDACVAQEQHRYTGDPPEGMYTRRLAADAAPSMKRAQDLDFGRRLRIKSQ